MHFSVVVIMESADDLFPNDQLTELLAPHDENISQGEGHWDWWSVGGRWDGAMLGLPDLELKEPCTLCGATGKRKDMEVANGCNGCAGTGQSDVWPTDDRYSRWDRNSCHVKNIPADFEPYAFVDPKGQWIEPIRAIGPDGLNAWQHVRALYPDHLAVMVDCHS